jgi:hypothetical protein
MSINLSIEINEKLDLIWNEFYYYKPSLRPGTSNIIEKMQIEIAAEIDRDILKHMRGMLCRKKSY